MIEYMFDTLLNAERRRAAAALDAMHAASRQENAAGAARLSAIADLYELRAPEDDVDKLNWVIDGYSGLVAEVAAAQGVSQRRAKAQVKLAIALRERLPAVAAVYASGAVDRRLIGAVVARTDLVDDPGRMTVIDAQLAAKIARWARHSGPEQQRRIDGVIARTDPAGVRAPRPAVDNRRVDIDPRPGAWPMSGPVSAPRSPRRWMPHSMSWPTEFAVAIRDPRPNAAPMPSARWRWDAPWPACAAGTIALLPLPPGVRRSWGSS